MYDLHVAISFRVLGDSALGNEKKVMRTQIRGTGEAATIFSLFLHAEDFEDDADEEVDQDSDSEDTKEQVGTAALTSRALHIHVVQRETRLCVQLRPV